MSVAGIVIVAVLMLPVLGLLALPFLLRQNRAIAKLEGGVADVAAKARLGAERGRYRASVVQIVASLWKAALAGAAAVAVYVLFFGLDAGKDLGVIRWVLSIPLALLLTILSLYALYVAITAAGTRIHLFDNGLVHLHPTKNAHAIRWEDAELYGGVGRHVKTCGPRLDRSIRLGPEIKVRHPDDGAELEVTDDSINHGTELFSTIQDNVARVRMPTMLHDIAEGRRIEFGPYVVDRHGVTAEDETVRWPDVLGLVYASTMGVGGVGLAHSGPEALGVTFDTDIPNLALLVTLVETLRTNATPAG